MKYAAIGRPVANDYWDEPVPQCREVLAEDREPVKTGLLDANGVPLYRVHETIKTGFVKP